MMDTGKTTRLDALWAEASGYWISACFQPWSAAAKWNALVNEGWRQWMNAIASAPNPWLPALAAGRSRQPASIDLFLPWLPRAKAAAEASPAGQDDVERVMRRMIALHAAEQGHADAAVPLEKAGTIAGTPPSAEAAAVAKAAAPTRRNAVAAKQAPSAEGEGKSVAPKAPSRKRAPSAARKATAKVQEEGAQDGAAPVPPKLS